MQMERTLSSRLVPRRLVEMAMAAMYKSLVVKAARHWELTVDKYRYMVETVAVLGHLLMVEVFYSMLVLDLAHQVKVGL